MAASPGSVARGITAQNDAANLELLAAASHFYGCAKRVAGLQFALTVPLAVVSYSVLFVAPALKPWTTFAALSVALIDVLLLERLQARYKRLGATAQEHFDCAVLDLPWNDFFCGPKLEAAEIASAAAKYSSATPLRDWYPPAAADAEESQCALICQRSAVRWDSAQRRHYATCLTIAGFTALFVLVAIALYKNYTVSDFILALYAPIAPAILWTTREVMRQRDAAGKLDSLRSAIDRLWAEVTSQPTTAIPTRRLQDALFEARARNALVFNWIYRIQRDEQETAMQLNAGAMVAALKGVPQQPGPSGSPTEGVI